MSTSWRSLRLAAAGGALGISVFVTAVGYGQEMSGAPPIGAPPVDVMQVTGGARLRQRDHDH
jgi:hypothetical protein